MPTSRQSIHGRQWKGEDDNKPGVRLFSHGRELLK